MASLNLRRDYGQPFILGVAAAWLSSSGTCFTIELPFEEEERSEHHCSYEPEHREVSGKVDQDPSEKWEENDQDVESSPYSQVDRPLLSGNDVQEVGFKPDSPATKHKSNKEEDNSK